MFESWAGINTHSLQRLVSASSTNTYLNDQLHGLEEYKTSLEKVEDLDSVSRVAARVEGLDDVKGNIAEAYKRVQEAYRCCLAEKRGLGLEVSSRSLQFMRELWKLEA